MRRTITSRILLVLPLLLAMLGCILTDAVSGIIAGKDAAQDKATQEPIYVIVEGEPPTVPAPAVPPVPTITPVPLFTSTPAVPGGLVLAPCVDRMTDCYGATSYITFIEIGGADEQSFDIPANTIFYISVSWNAVDEATLQQNLANVRFILEIDGQDCFDESFTFLETKPYILDESQIDSQKTMSATISGWVPQQPHTVRFGYEVLADINNGRYDYNAGEEFGYTLHICPDGGCPPAP